TTPAEPADKPPAPEQAAVPPGTAPGARGEGLIRTSYAYSLDNLKLALARVRRFIEKRKAAEKMEN
ncbi:MAG: hypothetical protein K2P45_03665, partial [Eubacterium sp.]|nr:hypothetical protein [Eubacterium sp.]